MKYILVILLFITLATEAVLYKDPTQPVNTRVADLLSRMTLEEKVNQLLMVIFMTPAEAQQKYGKTSFGFFLDEKQTGIPSIVSRNEIQSYVINQSRLNIPIAFFVEALHSGGRGATIFPMPCGLGPSWNTTLIREVYTVIGQEARICGYDLGFAPVLNLMTDPRFGRFHEGFSEDPVLVQAYAPEVVAGLQGKLGGKPSDYLDINYIASLAKHFAAYGKTQGGLNASPADISLQTLFEVYLAPWISFFKSGGRGLMTAHNCINSVPCHANTWLIQDIARTMFDWKEGLISSDEVDIVQLVDYKVAYNVSDACVKALSAGVDLDLGALYYPTLYDSVKSGRISVEILDRSVSNLLRHKFASGLFDHPYTDPSKYQTVDNPAHRGLALEAALQGIILLQNQNNSLPININEIKSIAVIGPNADNADNQVGSYTNFGAPIVTFLNAIKSDVGNKILVQYSQGASIDTNDPSLIPEAVALAQKSDLSILVIGDSLYSCAEAHGDRDHLDLIGSQQELLEQVAASNKMQGKKTIVVLIHGRPVTFGNYNVLLQNISALLSAWRPGEEGGTAIWKIIKGEVNPSGKLAQSWLRYVGQIEGPANPWYKWTEGNWVWSWGTEYYSYLDQPSTPLFPFGFGLSYTSYSYSNPSVTPSTLNLNPNFTLQFSVNVENTGNVAGDEVVQVYVSYPVSPIVRWSRFLAGFQKIHLNPKQSQKVVINISVESLGYYDFFMKYQIQPGVYTLYVGGDSTAKLSTNFTIL
eukprot:TRINITY_DN7880_c0_g1_i1.p1 TRINITY_DN7880_c0_g1~~TRINITY_DN7880_c0_g1_i1.p1  ORF type:complete len:755 (+),score=122.52 TRINITY_DN7880_c0_g1_i1:78-2342(+)